MAKVPASIRSKNPGAMWPGPVSAKWGATKSEALADGTGQGNKIAYFPTFVQGICAQIDLFRAPRYRNKPLADVLRVWSGGNYVESYIAFVLARVPGMTRNTIINDKLLNSDMGIAFLKAQAWHEAGQKYPAAESDWKTAQARVFGAKPVSNPKVVVASTAGGVASGAATATQSGLPLWAAILIGLGIALVVFVVWKTKQAATPAPVALPPPAVDNATSQALEGRALVEAEPAVVAG